MISKDTLVQEIKVAFGENEYPGDENIVAYPDDDMQCDVYNALKGRHWNDISDVLKSEKLCDELPILIPEAYHYYLPGFMLYSIEEPLWSDYLSFLIYSLNPTEHDTLEEFLSVPRQPLDPFHEERYHLFTGEQKSAIKHFLQYIHEIDSMAAAHFDEEPNEDVLIALKAYWEYY